ncbi:MAG: 30S ribosomal protein S7 [Nanoarchaeota archaeon]|nr:30S ribosomal protein S7 [Nanoarchaeota archaeon]MBU1005877.1 30S ribosomal protein S7 [Nanoarchaeota archaeon]MBU1946027.1 30S ribosomal protein S7 [Nanoarchaeota archaeon]
MAEILAFNKWNTGEIKVSDPGLVSYITLEPKLVPKTGARYHGNKFHKSKVFIVERLINKVMIPGHKSKKHFRSTSKITGKAHTAYDIVENTFKRIEKNTKENPIKVFVKALENAAPREEIITIEYGGARYPKAVECAPQRRIDIVLRLMTQGAYQRSFNSKKGIVECLAEEIIAAYSSDRASNAISKKLEVERQSDSSR